MDKEIKKISSCLKEIEITAKDEEVKPIYDETLHEFIKLANVPGFRKGKAPQSMILKIYGKQIMESFKEELVNRFIRKVFDEEKINPIDKIKLIKEDYKQGEYFSFTVHVETAPEFELTQYKDIEIEKPVFAVREEDVDYEFDKFLDSQKTFEDAEKVLDENYSLMVDIQELDESGIALIGKKDENVEIHLDKPEIFKDIKTKLLNTVIGDVVVANIESKKENEAKNIKLEITVKQIKKIITPELNEEFFKKLSKDKISTLSEFRDTLRKSIEAQMKYYGENYFRMNLENELNRKNDFDVPNVMVDGYLDDMIEEHKGRQPNKTLPIKFNAEEFKEENRAFAISKIKYYFIRSKIAELENLKIDDIDLEIHAEAESKRVGLPKERMLTYLKSSKEITNSLLEKKIDDFIISNNKIIEKDMSQKEESKIIA